MTDEPKTPSDGAWTLEQLLAAERAGLRLTFVLFWGHTPPSSGKIGPHVFSQWFPHEFTVDDVQYATADQFMMAEKARLFGDDHHREQILRAATPGEAKALGRRVHGFESDHWNQHRLDIVRRGSVAKFGSDEQMRNYLLSTGERVLVEASPDDPIWGIGLAKGDPSAERPSQWQGQNLLGFALMQARAELTRS